jgi:hypothetical protein
MRCTVVDGWGHSQSGLAGPCGGGAMNSHGGLMLVAPHASSGARGWGGEISYRWLFFDGVPIIEGHSLRFRMM